MSDDARTPDNDNLVESEIIPGGVTSAVVPVDEQLPNDLDDDDDDDDIPRARPRGDKVNADLNKDDEDGGSDLGGDLFGEDDDADQEEQAPEALRTLEDEELDSGDDQGRRDRMPSEPAEETQNVLIQESSMSRQPLPEPSDGEMYLTKVPKFMSIDPKAWHHTTYQPPTTEHHSLEAAPGFSAYSTAVSTIHWRRSPSNPNEIQSNARILRWSDGSLTLQFASNPTQQYEIEGNPLAPRQRNPVKPTPTSMKPGRKDHGNDSYTYLTAPDPTNGLLRVTHKITAGLSILPSAATTDDALEKLQNSLAAIAHGKNKTNTGGIELVQVDEDPELAKKKAEVAEREKDRARKRREAAENRERERTGRALGRAGLGSRGYGGGLTAGMLEDDEMGGGGRQRKPKQKRQRRNSEYSEDEDFGRKKSNFAADEYDEEDDFIAGSDEEEVIADDDDEDDGIVETTKQKPSKRATPDEEDEDAEGEDDDVPQAARATKRRRVIDEDDDE